MTLTGRLHTLSSHIHVNPGSPVERDAREPFSSGEK